MNKHTIITKLKAVPGFVSPSLTCLSLSFALLGLSLLTQSNSVFAEAAEGTPPAAMPVPATR